MAPLQGPAVDKKVRRFFAGGIAGVAAKTASAPLERSKIMLQAGTASGNGAAAGAKPPGVFKLMADIARAEGVRGLWAGNGANALRVLPSKGILFMSNDMYKELLRSTGDGSTAHMGATPPLASIAAGSLAGVTACICTYPLDLARARAAGHFNSRYQGIRGALARTVREEGFRGLYRGIGPTIAGAVPFEGVKFGIFDMLVARLPESAYDAESGRVSAAWSGMVGGFSGMAAGFMLFPNDTVRRRCQLDGADGAQRQYASAFDCWRKMFAAQGIRGFYHGFYADMLRRVPSAAIQFAVYGALK